MWVVKYTSSEILAFDSVDLLNRNCISEATVSTLTSRNSGAEVRVTSRLKSWANVNKIDDWWFIYYYYECKKWMIFRRKTSPVQARNPSPLQFENFNIVIIFNKENPKAHSVLSEAMKLEYNFFAMK